MNKIDELALTPEERAIFDKAYQRLTAMALEGALKEVAEQLPKVRAEKEREIAKAEKEADRLQSEYNELQRKLDGLREQVETNRVRHKSAVRRLEVLRKQ